MSLCTFGSVWSIWAAKLRLRELLLQKALTGISQWSVKLQNPACTFIWCEYEPSVSWYQLPVPINTETIVFREDWNDWKCCYLYICQPQQRHRSSSVFGVSRSFFQSHSCKMLKWVYKEDRQAGYKQETERRRRETVQLPNELRTDWTL